MKKLVFASCLLLLFAVASLAEGANYQIYSESKGFLGLGGHRVIMLDKSTGDTWLYSGDKWVPIAKEVSDEAKVQAKAAADDLARAQLATELAALKDKQAQDISSLKAKHEEELAALRSKLDANPPAVAAKPAAHHAAKAHPAAEAKKAASKADEENASGDEAPPAWLTE